MRSVISKSILFVVLACALYACADKDASEQIISDIRIVSLDYCADQFVLQLAPSDQILAVSPDAGKYFSYMRARAQGVPTVKSTAEDVLALNPTIIVRSYGGGPDARRFFERAGIKVVQLGFPAAIDEVRDNLLHVAEQLNAGDEGKKLVADLDTRLAALSDTNTPPNAMYMTPGGVTTGPGSLVHELMHTAGLKNYQTKPGWHSIPLERMVQQQPDMIAAASFGDVATHVDPWTLARHPVANRIINNLPAVELEGAWTSCGGWFLMDAIEALASGRAAVN